MAKRRKQKAARGSTSEDQGSGGFGGLGALLQAQGLQERPAVKWTLVLFGVASWRAIISFYASRASRG